MNSAASTPTKSTTVRLALNVLAFQLTWFAVVLSAAHGQTAFGLLALCAVLAGHLLAATNPTTELKLVVGSLGLGVLIESLNRQLGFFQAHTAQPLPALPALWLIGLWGLLATTLNVSMRWLKHRGWLAALLGAIAGPLAYMAGAKLGALQFSDQFMGMLALAVEWAICMPFLMKLSMAFDGIQFDAITQPAAETRA